LAHHKNAAGRGDRERAAEPVREVVFVEDMARRPASHLTRHQIERIALDLRRSRAQPVVRRAAVELAEESPVRWICKQERWPGCGGASSDGLSRDAVGTLPPAGDVSRRAIGDPG
jgi:hypothetical protein